MGECRAILLGVGSLSSDETQDTCFDVRSLFLSKLIKYMVARKLDARFNIVLFLTAHDPEKENRDRVSIMKVNWSNCADTHPGKILHYPLLSARSSRFVVSMCPPALSDPLPTEVRASNFEMIFIRLLHLLAHHPDFSADADGLRDMAK